MTRKWRNMWDLRDQAHPPPPHPSRNGPNVQPDCYPICCHPIVVIVVSVIGIIIFIWGLFLLVRYLRSTQKEAFSWISRLWWQTTINFLMVTLMALLLPWRLRGSLNLYSVVWILLIIEYAAFICCFPAIKTPNTDEDFAKFEKHLIEVSDSKYVQK